MQSIVLSGLDAFLVRKIYGKYTRFYEPVFSLFSLLYPKRPT